MRPPTPYPLTQLKGEYESYEIVRDLIDQCIDIMLNYRQSGHPGGSRSKAYMMVVNTLSGAMRWDIRDPGKSFADRLVLVAGHTVPLVYGMLAVYNEALRLKYEQTNDPKYLVKDLRKRFLIGVPAMETIGNDRYRKNSAFYFDEKKTGAGRAMQKTRILSENLNIVGVGSREVMAVNRNPKINDYEDGLQYYAAVHAGCEMIITEDLSDFYFSEIEIHTSKDFLLTVL